MGSLEDVIQDIKYDLFLLDTAKQASKIQKGEKSSSILRIKTPLRSGDYVIINNESHGVRAEMKSLFDMPKDTSSSMYITTRPDFPNLSGIVGKKEGEVSKRIVVGSFLHKGRKSFGPDAGYIQDSVISGIETWIPTNKDRVLVRVPPGSEDSMMMRSVKQLSLSDVAPSALHVWAEVVLPYVPHDRAKRQTLWLNATAKDNKYILGYNEQLKCALVKTGWAKGKAE